MKEINSPRIPKSLLICLLVMSATFVHAQVGIGTLTPAIHSGISIDKLNVTGTATASGGSFTPVSIMVNTDLGAALGVQNDLATNAEPALEIANVGATGVALRGLHLHGSGAGIGVYGATNSGSGWAGYFSGPVFSSVGYFIPSERKLKTNIQDIETESDILDKIVRLRPKSYTWKASEYPGMNFHSNRKTFGFIAQELKKVFPELVLSDRQIPDPSETVENYKVLNPTSGYHLVDYNGLIPILTAAIQQQQEIITSQEDRIKSLAQALINLEKKVSDLEKQ